jgi:hydrogenase nickel incorporation protein HypA/HybF
MHELALASAIVDACRRHAGGRTVAKVEVRVGRLRQVVPDALAFGFELTAQGTVVEGAELAIEEVAVRVACRACAAETEVDAFPFACGTCGSLDVEVTSGEEFELMALELEEVEFVGSK